ncbi:methyltransferase [Hirsutella rhossiliensis]|uniref:Methyltransferase domain-containing protein n=1 Tax=Hirsutella rhossiliensis TaxID=111463 RepID=A0A9P8SHZ2_9HYPO|nr:methyltransferase domain-containing protein [Hirsutella rhossiliensis]KAH0961506.1 methyltransferase domain-containing protein [Hirsutella rhossiliensis]
MRPSLTLSRSARQKEDEGLESQSTHSSLTSITSSVLYGVVAEGQRTYAAYGKEEYGFPMDDREMDRMDLCHSMYYALLDKKRFSAPINPNPQRILDLGCGTGIWAVDMADEYPSAEVVGVDIAPTQPDWVPPNCSFELDDIEQPWTWKESQADFIFGRDLFLSVRDFPRLIDQCYRHLKSGGWLEFQSVTGIVQCDDGTLPKDSAYQAMSDNVEQACKQFGTPVDDPLRWKQWLVEGGFEGVTEKVHKLPCSPWALDKRLKLVGMWEQHHLLNNVDGMIMRLFHKGLGWTEQEILVFGAMFRKDLRDLSMHAYFPYHVVYGRKPL